LVKALGCRSYLATGLADLRSLLQHGADVNAEDILGLRPLDYALLPEVADALRIAGARGLDD
jgi:hypothetical protein